MSASERRRMQRPPFAVTRARLVRAPRALRHCNVVCLADIEVNGTLRIEGIPVRCYRDGTMRLSFRKGRRLGPPRVWPLDQSAREELERQVFGRLGLCSRREWGSL